MNKKAMSPELLVGIIALLATFVVLLTIVYPPVKNALFGTGETAECQFSILLSSVTKTLTFGFGDIPAECKMKRMTITDKHIEQYQNYGKKATDRYRKQNVPAQSDFPQNKEGINRWAFSKIIADEMVDCYNKGWRGGIDLTATGWPTDIIGKETGAFLCILCTRILVDDTAQQMLGDNFIKIGPWLDANNKEGKTYMALLTEGTHTSYQSFVKYSWIELDRPTAVTFLAYVGKDVGDLTTHEVTGGVALLPYETLTKDIGFNMQPAEIVHGKTITAVALLLIPTPWTFGAGAGILLSEFFGWTDPNVQLGEESPAKCAVIIGD